MPRSSLNLRVGIATLLIGIPIGACTRRPVNPGASFGIQHFGAQGIEDGNVSKNWRKIKIGEVSFKIPAQLRNTGLPGNAGTIEAFRGMVDGVELYVNYSYGRVVSRDANPPFGSVRDVTINGRKGDLSVFEYKPEETAVRSNIDSSLVELYLPNLGKGKDKFELYAACFDLNVAMRVIETVHVQSPA